ncbi:MAG: N-6 DNA methylase [Candidatus Lokiarchaeota archaeon]|nr:N-6 DNA methylase [Candidatus Lokiarchaeota archaeon]
MEKELGVVLTPPKTAEYIISKLGKIKENQKVLDPCVGPGIFVKSLIKSGVNKSQIFCHDINSSYKEFIEELGVSFKTVDNLLSFNSECYNEYDFIVGNPPYLNKASNYVRKNRTELKKIYGKINAHETYSMFIVNAIWCLKEGGKLGFITSDSFLTLSTHKKLRKFILENCKINEIMLAPAKLFDNQNVSTNPVIIMLTKWTGPENKEERDNNIMRVIPRVENERDYFYPPIEYQIKQKKYYSLPFYIFHIEVEEQIIKLFEKAPKLEHYLQGYIGMHTHNNRKYIAAIKGSDLAKIFINKNEKIHEEDKKYKIISEETLNSNKWCPYLKRGGGDQYYRPIIEALNWEEESIKIYDIPCNVPFLEEGIVISGISSRLAARYMPKGCYWDSNKAIGFLIKENSISVEYMLGILNSSLYNYLAKGIINNTNSIQITGIHSLPFLVPTPNIKSKIENIVRHIIREKKKNQEYNYVQEQKNIDDLMFDFYSSQFNFPSKLKEKLDKKYSIYSIM